MRAGRLRERVRIERAIDAPDGQGGTTRQWLAVDVVAADITAGTGREFTAAKQLHATMTHLVTIRYREDITAKMRLRRGAAVLWIIAPPADPDARRSRLNLVCEERAGEVAA